MHGNGDSRKEEIQISFKPGIPKFGQNFQEEIHDGFKVIDKS